MLLEVVLSGAPCFAPRKGALVVALAGVYAEMARKVTTGCETTVACLADMFFLGGGVG